METEVLNIVLTKAQAARLREVKESKGISISFQVRNALDTQAEQDNADITSPTN